jgi:hypothetical protein
VDQLDFEGFDETDFEEFCFELLARLDGFHNVDWRKGTPKPSSPADRGRDIVAEVDHVDVDGARHIETWFVDCKHYARGVPPEALQGLLTWAQAERPHVALVIASGFLSNAAKDYLRDYEQNNRPPFRIKYWERPIVGKLASGNRELLDRFFTDRVRTQSEVVAAEQEFFDKVWYGRHLVFRAAWEAGDERWRGEEIYQGALKAAEEVRERWGEENLAPYSDFEWGMINGKLSALRWALGWDWDTSLDT